MPYTNGQYTILFNLYDQAVGGALLWSETHQKVGVINGMVNVFLGSINPALSTVDFSQTRHLGITIDADGNPNTPDPEMVPRQMIIPAFWAKNSEKLANRDWSSILVSGNDPQMGQIAGSKIQSGGITSQQIANNTITGSQIANNTITSQQLAGAIITSNQIVNGGISSTNLAPGAILTANIANGAVTLPKLAPRQTLTNTVGVGGVAVSALANEGHSSSQYVPIPNLTVTITTTGRPVHVMLMPDTITTNADVGYLEGTVGVQPNMLTATGFQVSIIVDSVRQLGQQQFYSGAYADYYNYLYVPASSIQFVDFGAAPGVHTYMLQVKSVPNNTGITTVNLNAVRLVAYEM